MSNGHKWPLSLICICVMAIPFVLLVLLEKSKTNTTDIIKESATPASGIFIIPPGGKEVNRDTTGKRVACCNVGDKITGWANNPEALFLINETTSPKRIRGKGFSGHVSKMGKKNYLRFINCGDKEEKIKARVTPR